MLVCCSVISLIILLALFGTILVAIVQAIVAKAERTAWAKTLVGLPLQELEAKLSVLEEDERFATLGFLEMSKGQQQQVVSKVSDIKARIEILKQLISERRGLESGKR
jgi:hypothetical protein